MLFWKDAARRIRKRRLNLMTDWCVAYVALKREAHACDALQGYTPMSRRTTKPRRKRKSVAYMVPAIPRYIFFPDSVVGKAIESSDVLIVLRRGDESFARVRDDVVSRLKELERAGEFDVARRSGPDVSWIKPGQDVRLTYGVFSGLTGKVIAPDRMLKTVQMMVEGVKVTTDSRYIEKIP